MPSSPQPSALSAETITPASWARSLSGPPVLDRSICGPVPLTVRRWRSIRHEMEQKALDHHFMSLHLGGAKRIHRRGEGVTQTRDAACGAFSIVPQGAAFRWRTEGPIDFAHIYFDSEVVDAAVEQAFGRDPSNISLQETMAAHDPLIHALGLAILEELQTPVAHQAYLDDLTHLLILQILKSSSGLGELDSPRALAIAPFRLKRAFDFIEENLASPITATDIAAAAGISTFHFSRAFRRSTGLPPYAYLLGRRVARAKSLLGSKSLKLRDIALQCGFNGAGQFSRAFRRAAGVAPNEYRRSL